MPAQTLISVEDYLHSSYEYDVEYDDGELVERKMPTGKHSEVMGLLILYLGQHAKTWNIKVLPDCRVRVSPSRVRIPDISVISGGGDVPNGPLVVAPLFVIEILSPDDSLTQLRSKAQEYLAMGVKHVWTVDPVSGECYEHLPRNMVPVEDLLLRVDGSHIVIPMAEILESLR